MKNNKNILIAIGIILFLVLIVVVRVEIKRVKNQTENKVQSTPSSQMLLFYGDTCPHCQEVEKYIKDNKVEDNFKFQKLEVYHNKKNAKLLWSYAQHCKLNTSQGIGVPLFWTGQKCLIGETAVINFFQKK